MAAVCLALVPRGWLLVGLLGLAPAFVAGLPAVSRQSRLLGDPGLQSANGAVLAPQPWDLQTAEARYRALELGVFLCGRSKSP